MRQQRTPNWRGQLQLPNRRPVPDIAWNPVVLLGPVLRIEPQTDMSRCTLHGVPQMTCSQLATTPIAAAIFGNYLDLTYGAPLTFPQRFSLPPVDPALRDPFGAYLATANQYMASSANPLQPVANLTWVVTSILGNVATLDVTGVGIAGFLVNPTKIRNETNAEDATTTAITGAQLLITFPSAINSGDSISMPTTEIYFATGNWAILEAGPHAAP